MQLMILFKSCLSNPICSIERERCCAGKKSSGDMHVGRAGDLYRPTAWLTPSSDKIALRLNQRPRKTVGFQTPASKLRASVAPTL
jgi:hypothetical protein